MLIRSQDSEILINLNTLAGIEITKGPVKTTITSYTTGCTYLLGEYSTKAKAMKVLDMIQDAYEEYKIACTFLTGFTGHREIVESNDIRVNGFKEIVKNFKKNMVFQMPEDSEVEV
jgi:hypothetical protein|nr:MAG TPA: hypothetical protein [Caudoviricetes sp.]